MMSLLGVTFHPCRPFLVLSAVLAGCDYAQDPPLQKIMSENVSRSLYSHMNGLGHAAEAVAELVAPPAATFIVLRGGLLGIAAVQLSSTIITVTVLLLATIKERTVRRTKSTSSTDVASQDAGGESGSDEWQSGDEDDDEEEEEWLEMVSGALPPPVSAQENSDFAPTDDNGIAVPCVDVTTGDKVATSPSARARRFDRIPTESSHDVPNLVPLSDDEGDGLLRNDELATVSPRRSVFDSAPVPAVPEEGTLYRHQWRLLTAASDFSGWLKGRLGRVWHCGVEERKDAAAQGTSCMHRLPGGRYVSSLRIVRMTQSTLTVISRNVQLWWTMFLSFACILLEAASDETFLPVRVVIRRDLRS